MNEFQRRLLPGRQGFAVVSLLILGVLAGCQSTPSSNARLPAPVEDRSAGRTLPRGAAPLPIDYGSRPTVKAEPGSYVVKPGDTLMKIGLETGQSWRDLARWNNLDNPDVIEVGQVIRVLPPGAEAGVAVARPVTAPKVESRPLGATRPAVPMTAASAPGVVPATVPVPPPAAPAAAPKEGDDDVTWAWPASGAVVAAFDDSKSKGLSISGKAGDPVLAAADGRVVYAGSGLRGYGNLIIVKHNATYLTAYAHNQALLVKEDQGVRRGQKIAEMGSSDADKVKLHFEIRKLGKPIDPAKLLPPR